MTKTVVLVVVAVAGVAGGLALSTTSVGAKAISTVKGFFA
jgi:hypothetical protein